MCRVGEGHFCDARIVASSVTDSVRAVWISPRVGWRVAERVWRRYNFLLIALVILSRFGERLETGLVIVMGRR